MSTFQLYSLDNTFISAEKIVEMFKCTYDKRYPEKILHKFIIHNRKALDWLGISAGIAEENGRQGVILCTSKLIGAAPLKDPVYGRNKLDIVVKSRFNEDVASLIDLLETTIAPDFLDLDLLSAETVRAPIYFDCINYIQSFINAIQSNWRKFSVQEEIDGYPKGTTNWTKYAQKSYEPGSLLRYPNRNNKLHIDHPDWLKLCFVLKIALDILQSHNVPLRVRIKYQEHVIILQRYLAERKTLFTRENFHIAPQDPVTIKELKILANIIINYNRKNAKAWRIDSSKLFERYVQYICKLVGQRIGGEVRSNPKISISGEPYLPNWALRHLEPDAVLRIGDSIISIDAKYKAHMLNNDGTELRESFRADLHQILAYCSLGASTNKIAWIFYPYKPPKYGENKSPFRKIKLKITSSMSSSNVGVYLFGISLDISDISNITEQLVSTIGAIVDKASFIYATTN